MKLLKRTKYILAVPLFIVASLALQFAHTLPTYAAALTWTGGGDGTKFSDGDNWSTGNAPQTGDDITIQGMGTTQTVTLVNDLSTNVALGNVTIVDTNASSASTTTTFTLDRLLLEDGATISRTYGNGAYSNYANLNTITNLETQGDLTLNNTYISGTFDINGDLTVTSGSGVGTVATGSSISGTITAAGSSFTVSPNLVPTGYIIGTYGTLRIPSSVSTLSTPITFSGTDSVLTTSSLSSWDDQTKSTVYTDRSVTVSSPITLLNNASIRVEDKVTTDLTGTITYNNHTLSKAIGSAGVLKINGAVVTPAAKTTALDGDSQTSVSVGENEIATLNGSRSYIAVYTGGLLKGTGTVDSLSVYNGGVLNPGNSPGTMTILSDAYILGTYQVEIQNAQAYDKLVVGAEHSGSYPAVELTSSAKLDLSLFGDWAINAGDAFTIIDNQSASAVEGTFDGLAEGTQLVVDGITFSITYVGGTGNDVVLTALNTGTVPGTPNTGAEQTTQANPAIVAGVGILSAGVFIALAIRRRITR